MAPAAPPADTTTPASPDAPAALDAGWTPYTPDPSKDAATNLQLKEAHDAKAPAGHDPNVKVEPKAPPADPNKPAEAPKPETPPAPAPLLLTDLVAPEGFTLDPAAGTEMLQILNQHAGDPKALANALVALQAKVVGTDEEARSQAWDNLQTEWKKQSEADPEIGGAKYATNTALATEIGARFGGPKLQETLDLTGMGNHPEWLRFIAKIAPFVSEAAPVTPGTTGGAGPAFSSTNLYPEQGKK